MNATCSVVDNAASCSCKSPYVGDGTHCTGRYLRCVKAERGGVVRGVGCNLKERGMNGIFFNKRCGTNFINILSAHWLSG